MPTPILLNVIVSGEVYEVLVGHDNLIRKITHYHKNSSFRQVRYADLRSDVQAAIIDEYKKRSSIKPVEE